MPYPTHYGYGSAYPLPPHDHGFPPPDPYSPMFPPTPVSHATLHRGQDHGHRTTYGQPGAVGYGEEAAQSFPMADMSTPIQTFDIPTDDRQRDFVSVRNSWEAKFAAGLFEHLVPVLPSSADAPFASYASDQEKLAVVCRCIKRAGFSLGKFLAALFADVSHPNHPEISNALSYFLHSRSPDAREHPVSIIKLIYHHKSTRREGGRRIPPPTFHIPRYALPPSQRLRPQLTHAPHPTQHNAILDWAVALVLARVDEEANSLLSSEGSMFLRKKSIGSITWDLLRSWDMTRAQEEVANTAPVLFAIMATAATSKTVRLNCDITASPPEDVEMEEETSEDGWDDTQSDESEMQGDRASRTMGDSAGAGASTPRHRRDTAPGVPPGMQRDPWQAVTLFIIVMLRLRNQYALVFATIFGIYCFACGANRDLIQLLCCLGISISYPTVLATLSVLAQDKLSHLRSLAAAAENRPPTFQIVYDNVNKIKRAWQQTATNVGEMLCGTAATLIELEDVKPGALEADHLLKNIADDARTKLSGQDLIDDLDGAHLAGIGAGHILREWVQYVPSLARFSSDVEQLFRETHAKRRLRLRKSKIYPMQTSGINEATTVGTVQLLRNLLLEQLAMAKSSFKWLMMVGGDLLTVDRQRKVKLYTMKANTPFERYEWLVPTVQLWHLKWNWMKCIFRMHWTDANEETGKSVFGLRSDCNRIKRGAFNPKVCDFYPGHAILQDRFSAMALEILRLICEEKTRRTAVDRPLIDALDRYFAPGGVKEDITFHELLEWAQIAYRRYMTSSAYTDALGIVERSQTIYNDPESVECVEEELSDVEEASKSAPAASSTKRTATADQPDADRHLANSINFLRVTLWYLEMCLATAEGDIGRVFEIIKFLRFSFWGAGATSYGNELLEMACNFMAEFPDDLRDAILDNYLVNPSGQPGRWFELDLLQEHFNFWIKRLFNSKTISFDAQHLSQRVALNIQGLGDLRSRPRAGAEAHPR
uniref:DUF6589 domain-containing protein n=1 Tax=Schizophyllum commune (strain H4-8 / FGSC 9210) TaxID=578458 RepID=D8Q8N9_SCHCM